jgi:hypothetical protein
VRYIAILFLALLIPSWAFAGACNSDCTFKRGDVNCSGTVDTTDLVILYQNGYYSNGDAADVDDNGIVQAGPGGADTIYLGAYFYSGGPAPACPGPTTAGKDCTGDYYENCCSPPDNPFSPLWYSCASDVTNSSTDPWDYVEDDDWQSGDQCVGYGRAENWGGQDDGCEHLDSHADMMVTATGDDTKGFTKKRLQNGVQKAWLHLEIEVWFDHGARCLDVVCGYNDKLQVNVVPDDFMVYTHWAPMAGGTGGTYAYGSFMHDFFYSYFTTFVGACTIVTTDNAHQQYNFPPANISASLASAVPNDCTVYKVDEVTAVDLPLDFIRKISTGTGLKKDIAETELIEVELKAWVEYEWCTCQ